MRCIDADEIVYESIDSSDTNRYEYYYGTGIFAVRKEDIDAMPTIEPERKKGAWINEGRIIRCNKCKIGYSTVKGMRSALTYNFCPNCGASMREEGENR